jgi:hypothetical protein
VPHQVRELLSIATTNLQDELICSHQGKDSCITIESHCERRRNNEGRNLERDFESLAPAREAPAARAMHPPSSPVGSGGVYGSCTTSPDGGLATQVLAPPAG